MIQQGTQYEQILRRALHAAADGIEPEADGLERIRARLTMPAPLPVAWLNAGYADVSGLTMGWLQRLSEWLRAFAGRLRGSRGRAAGAALTARRAVPAPRFARTAGSAAPAGRAGNVRRLRQASRSRPLAAAGAVAVFVTVFAALVLATLPGQLSGSLDGIFPFLGSSSPASGHGGSTLGGGHSLANGAGSQHGWSMNPFVSNGPGATVCPPPFKVVAPGKQGGQPGPASGHSGAAVPPPVTPPSPAPSTNSSSPSPSPSTSSPSPSSSPSVTPSGSGTPSPGTSTSTTGGIGSALSSIGSDLGVSSLLGGLSAGTTAAGGPAAPAQTAALVSVSVASRAAVSPCSVSAKTGGRSAGRDGATALTRNASTIAARTGEAGLLAAERRAARSA